MTIENDENEFDGLSDEEFMKLTEPSATPDDEDENFSEENEEEPSAEVENQEEANASTEESVEQQKEVTNEQEETPSTENASEGNADPMSGTETSPDDDTSKGEVEDKAEEKESENKPAAKAESASDGDLTPEQTKEALDFFKLVTTPFKADGKDFTVRSAEDAVRLIQQGVNYSRRMHELKPMRQIHRMLSDHGLADENKLSFLIDIQKGNVDAIKKLIKDKGIDYLDLDTETENQYETRSYAGNTRDQTFRDALDEAVADPDGQVILDNIHKTWDDDAKEKLRGDPSILGNLMKHRRAGFYEKIIGELDYQRTMGYLNDVDFLTAYDQVGLAMTNAGLLGSKPQPEDKSAMGELGSQNAPTTPQSGQPVASGVRKEKGNEEPTPNPHLSSKPPATPGSNSQQTVTDFGKMSDEDFLKMPPPG